AQRLACLSCWQSFILAPHDQPPRPDCPFFTNGKVSPQTVRTVPVPGTMGSPQTPKSKQPNDPRSTNMDIKKT
ncbi:hypothetical protein ACVGWT_00565, partial [Enterobacter hormaechei]